MSWRASDMNMPEISAMVSPLAGASVKSFFFPPSTMFVTKPKNASPGAPWASAARAVASSIRVTMLASLVGKWR